MTNLERCKEELKSSYEYLETLEKGYENWEPSTVEEKVCMPLVETLDEFIDELLKIKEEAGDNRAYVEMSEDVEYIYYQREETEKDRDEFYQHERDITEEEIRYLKAKIKEIEDER